MHITLLEPRMVAAVDLDQLAHARPAIARLVAMREADRLKTDRKSVV